MTDQHTPTILIIDNDDGVVRALSTRLESLGYVCETASSGDQGVSMFKSESIDLVITDLVMPAGDGVSVVQAIRGVSAVPIIIVTGFRKECAGPLTEIPGVTVLEKPFESAVLVELVEAELALAGS